MKTVITFHLRHHLIPWIHQYYPLILLLNTVWQQVCQHCVQIAVTAQTYSVVLVWLLHWPSSPAFIRSLHHWLELYCATFSFCTMQLLYLYCFCSPLNDTCQHLQCFCFHHYLALDTVADEVVHCDVTSHCFVLCPVLVLHTMSIAWRHYLSDGKHIWPLEPAPQTPYVLFLLGVCYLYTAFHKIGTPLYFCNNFFKCWSIWMKITPLYLLGNLLSGMWFAIAYFIKYSLYRVI